MDVAELINELATYPPTLEVGILDEGGTFYPVQEVTATNGNSGGADQVTLEAYVVTDATPRTSTTP